MGRRSPRSPSLRTVVATASVAAVAAALGSLSHPAALRVDGIGMRSDVPPVTTAQGAFVPLRAVATMLGATTAYDAKTGAIELARGRDTMRLRVGDPRADFDGRSLALGAAPFSVRGRTMVSLALVARAFRSSVRYDGARAQIDVVTGGGGAPGDDLAQ